MENDNMHLKVLLPDAVVLDRPGVRRVVAETGRGSYGLWPRRLDCVMALVPGILVYETKWEGESYVAVDAGILVKTGEEVLVSVRRAVTGRDLDRLHRTVQHEFLVQDDREKQVRATVAKWEIGLVRRIWEARHA